MLSILRILFSFLLLLLKPLSVPFFILYTLCGISDIGDGYMARQLKVTSKVGALLDSIGDFVFIGIVLITLIPVLEIPEWLFFWILLIALIRMCSLLVGWIRFKTAAFLHTYANKMTGFLLFCFPLFIGTLGIRRTGIVVCVIATLSAAEELGINLISKELDRDVKTVGFIRVRKKRKS